MPAPRGLRTWIEISKGALIYNVRAFRSLLEKNTKLYAVVKSNAYGHGLFVVPRVVQPYVDGFCVDSATEAFALRNSGIRKPILVLGMTLPELLPQAYKEDISIAIATPEALQNILRSKHPPKFHIKIDTGLRRHGFLPEAVPSLLKQLTQHPRAARNLEGIFTHFARTGDAKGKKSTARQFAQFEEVRREFARAGFNNLICHCSATGGLLTSPAYHLNAVRLGIGLYGHYPNPGIEKEWAKTLRLRPALIWKSVVGETKIGSKGDAVGYDGTEVLNKKSLLAALPVGYWHGLPRAASSKGSVGIRGVAAKIAGRVSMDITVVHAPPATHLGDIATLIGMTAPTRAEDLAAVANTNHYEILTRLNPLIERILVP